MSVTRNIRNINRQLLNQDSEKSDLEDSHILEERLKNLLSTNKREFHRTKNIFNDCQGDVTKLRGSIITRALQKVVCSTPMPTEKQRDFFLSETSFNISPIEPISEENVQGNHEQPHNNKDSTEKKEKEEIFDKEAKVVLTRTPLDTVVILDSSSEIEKDDKNVSVRIKHVENKPNGSEKKICYNTRSQSKSDSSKQVNATVTQERENSKSVNHNTTNIKSKAQISERSSRKDSLTNRRRIDRNSLPTSDTKSPTTENNADQSSSQAKKDITQTKASSQSKRKKRLGCTKSNANKTKSSNQTENEEVIMEPMNYAVSPNRSGKDRNYSRSSSQTKKDENLQLNSKSLIVTRNSKSRIEAMDQIKSPCASKGEKVLDNTDAEQILPSKDIENNVESAMIKSLIDEIYDKKSQSQYKAKTPTRGSNRINSVLNSLRSKSSTSCRELDSEDNRVNITRDRQGIPNIENSNVNSVPPEIPTKGALMIENKSVQYTSLEGKDKSTNCSINKTKSTSQARNKQESTIESLNYPMSPNRSGKGRNCSRMINYTKENEKEQNSNCILCSPIGTRSIRSRIETTQQLKSPNTSKIRKDIEGAVSEQIVPIKNRLQNSENKLEPNVSLISKNYDKTSQVSPLKMRTRSSSNGINSKLNSLGRRSPSSRREIETIVNNTMAKQTIPFTEKNNLNKDLSPRACTEEGKSVQEATCTNKIIEKVRRTELVDAGTSPLGNATDNYLGYSKDGKLKDSERIDKLNILLTKMSRKFFDSPNTPIQNESNYKRLTTRINHEEGENSVRSQFAPYHEKVSCRKINREVQTSVRRPTRKISPKRSFARSIFTRTVIEQQTQTTNSVDKTLKSYRKNRNTDRRAVASHVSDSSRNSSTTDQSEVLKELEREENMLFQSLTEGILPPSFSSSEDEVVHSINQENLPWRLDDDIIPVPRRSSYKLNFLRSAQEIEMERKSTINAHRTCDFSDSDSEIEGRSVDKKRNSVRKKQVGLGHTKKKVYSRPNQGQNENNYSKAFSKEPLTDEERSSSRNSVYDIPPSEPEIEDPQDPADDKECRTLTSPAKNVVSKDCTENVDLETTLTIKNVNEHNKSHESNDCLRDKVADLLSKSSPPLRNSYLETPVASEVDGKKATQRGKKNGKIDFGKSNTDGIVEKPDDDNEVLAVPLEDSDEPALTVQEKAVKAKSTPRKSKSQELRNIDNVNVNEGDEKMKGSNKKTVLKTGSSKKSHVDVSSVTTPLEEPQFKMPKARVGRKSKKQIMADNDDAVSSTTDSTDSGLRRSGRERKAPPRRVYGVLATYSEKILHYYNGLNEKPADNVTINKSSKPRTGGKGGTKKNSTMKESMKSEANNSKRPRTKKKGKNKPEVIENVEMTAIINTNCNNNDTDRVSVNEVHPLSDTDISKTSTRKKRNNDISSTTPAASSDRTPEEVPKKRNRKSKLNNNAELTTSSTKNINTNKVSSSTSNHDISCSARLGVDSTDVPDVNTNAHDTNLSCQNNNDNIAVLPPIVFPCDNGSTTQTTYDDRDTDNCVCPSSEYQDTCNLEVHTQNKPVDKDSGRSTMLKSTTFDDSLRASKTLTGRIGKKYKKKGDDFCSKISKVLSRSINYSNELELLNGNDLNFTESRQDDRTLRRSSIMQTTTGDHIHLLSNNEIVSMKYVDQIVKYKVVRDNLMVTDPLKNGVGSMGHLKLLPGCQKPLHIARKFNLFYFVIEGEGFIQVHNKTARIGKLSKFIIPLGVEYSINNLSKEDSLVLGFVKVPPNMEA